MQDADIAAIINAPRLCPNCGTQLVRRAKDNDYAYGKRIYCSIKCYRAALKNGKHCAYQVSVEGRYIGP